MIRIINLRVAVTVKATIEEIVEKKYPQMKGHIQKIHVVRRAVDARKKPNIVFVYTLFVEAQHEEKIIKKLSFIFPQNGTFIFIYPLDRTHSEHCAS